MQQPDFVLGRRIVVCGVTGSGKSTLTRQLGAALGLTVIELDELHWALPDWTEPDDADFRDRVEAALAAAPEGWVCDGNYMSKLGDRIIGNADTIVWLNLPLRVTFWRLLQRTVSRAWRQELLWGTNRESWRRSFTSRDSILWWSLSHHRPGRDGWRQRLSTMSHARAYELRSGQDVARLRAAAEAANA
jgi:adenylate kinase family enzyme